MISLCMLQCLIIHTDYEWRNVYGKVQTTWWGCRVISCNILLHHGGCQCAQHCKYIQEYNTKCLISAQLKESDDMHNKLKLGGFICRETMCAQTYYRAHAYFCGLQIRKGKKESMLDCLITCSACCWIYSRTATCHCGPDRWHCCRLCDGGGLWLVCCDSWYELCGGLSDSLYYKSDSHRSILNRCFHVAYFRRSAIRGSKSKRRVVIAASIIYLEKKLHNNSG